MSGKVLSKYLKYSKSFGEVEYYYDEQSSI